MTANIVAFDKPLMYNRLGAANVNGIMFALARDVVNDSTRNPITTTPSGAVAGQVGLRPDKRHRPLVLRLRVGDCLTVNLRNLLTPAANPFNVPKTTAAGQLFNVDVDDQVADRFVGFHAAGLELLTGVADDGSFVGNNASSLIGPGGSATYRLYAGKEGAFMVKSDGSTFGADANQGNSANGLFGQVIVEPRGAAIYRGQVFEEELRLARTGTTTLGQPILNYEAVYPNGNPWNQEGKAGLPVLNVMRCNAQGSSCEIVHSEINAVIAFGPNGRVNQASPNFPASTYPLESVGKRNPSLPNRLEAFRDFAQVWHDEPSAAQAFPGFFVQDPVFRYVLAGVKDGFMINYGSGGIGSEIIANRLGVGPMHDCLSCAYEEFFLTSFAVGDPGLTVDIPANLGLENLRPGQTPPAGAQGPKANFVIGAEDPSNVHHSYVGDFVKFRNTHIGKEQHVFHLHNHQWLYNPNDDNSNYLDAQGVGPGVGYTYEINFGGSGNRNKSAGDAIFHCHFYPHFAQGMWYHWRHNDTFQFGTVLAATPNTRDADGFATAIAGRFHGTRWALANTTPAAGARAYPDGEIEQGTPIPAVVPLPGKPMPPVPGRATVVAKVVNGVTVGSNARVIDRNVNPGFPFWIAGMEDVVGQRPPTPPLDMLTAAQAQALRNTGGPLFSEIIPDQADGFDGGLPRHALEGVAAGGQADSVVTAIDFSKVLEKSKPVYFPEEGTDLEKVAMAFHANRCVTTFRPNGAAAACAADNTGGFILNGSKPVIGAPYHNPCIDDRGNVLKEGVLGQFFSGETLTAMSVRGRSAFNSDTPRIYKGSNLQFDAVLTKTGYHYPQQRIVALWQDVVPVIRKSKAPEPLVMRLNTFDCAVFHHSNLVPENYEIDDYQVRTPTDIIGQHIHLPKWDLTTTDGAANGWNYEDGTLSPGTVRERIHSINCFNGTGPCPAGITPGPAPVPTPDGRTHLEPAEHPFWAGQAAQLGGEFPELWLGARTTMQRWFADPVVNTEGVDRGLGIIFTHDHYGPSTHQQIGLYATVLAEPAASHWAQNETGQQLGCRTPAERPLAAGGAGACRNDGGPLSWQAAILPQAQLAGVNVGAGGLEPYREFYFEYSDFQHAYEAGVYAGADQEGVPLPGTGPRAGMQVADTGNPDFDGTAANAFRFAINPPARFQIEPVFPELVLEAVICVRDPLTGAPLHTRPCPQAIDVQDPGMLTVNYRAEPVALRIFDPNRVGPDGKRGMQADGQRGDLAFALQSRTDRAIPRMNVQPTVATVINGTRFPPPINTGGVDAGDPFTPMMRTFAGDLVRVKVQAGGHEEEHNISIHGVKWLQSGSAFGRAPNAGWRNAQAGGISEQFTLTTPVVPLVGDTPRQLIDYAYSVDAGNDGWWSGMWGILRAYENPRNDLFALPTTQVPVQLDNATRAAFNGVCPIAAPVRSYDVSAVLANRVLPPNPNVTIQDLFPAGHVGAAPTANNRSLVYNHRTATVTGTVAEPGEPPVTITHQGPIHDPTAMLYVRTEDLQPNPTNGTEQVACAQGGASNPLCPVLLRADAPIEPLVLRAAAGDCIQVTLRNRLPVNSLDLATFSTMIGVVKRDRLMAEGSTTFQTNLFQASGFAGLHPQLVAYDASRADGAVVGGNASGNNALAGVAPPVNGVEVVRWYAGDIAATKVGGQYSLTATPVELGGSNLIPADKVKQGAKSLVGTLVIEPAGANWTENTLVFDHQDGTGTRQTRAQATVTAGATAFRDFSAVLTKGLTEFYADSSPVEHMNGEGDGIPEDSQEASGMALNYGVEPMWFRFGILPQAPFGNVAGGYGGVPNAHEAYSNALVGGDPVTPVFQADRLQQTRIRTTNPYGTTRGSTFALHGHNWLRDPYVCPGESRNGLAGACNVGTVGSRAIGANPQGFTQSGQESWTPYSHFDIVLNSVGGGNGIAGDYLIRDQGSFGNASGVWGILRVQ